MREYYARGARDNDVTAEVVGTIDEVHRETLDSPSDDFSNTWGEFKILEAQDYPSGIERHYLVVYKERKMIGFLPFSIQDDGPFFIVEKRSRLMKRVVNLATSLGIHLDRGRTLTCQLPYWRHNNVLPKEKTGEKEILHVLITKVDELCRKEEIQMSSFGRVFGSDRTFLRSLQNNGYCTTETKNTLRLDVEWSSFDDYVNSLEYDARKNVRREIRRCNASRVIIQEEKEIENYADIISVLASNTNSKYGDKTPVSPSNFSNFQKYAKDKTRLFVAKLNGTIVGFSLCIQNPNTLDVLQCGLDYGSLTKTDFTYFNLAYYAPIRLAIEENIKRVYFGYETEKVKLKRGCKIEKTYSFFKIHNKLLRRVVLPYVNKRKITQFA